MSHYEAEADGKIVMHFDGEVSHTVVFGTRYGKPRTAEKLPRKLKKHFTRYKLKPRKIARLFNVPPRLLRTDSEFFAPRTIAQLTKDQGVDPTFDVRTIEGVWPDDEDVEVFLKRLEE